MLGSTFDTVFKVVCFVCLVLINSLGLAQGTAATAPPPPKELHQLDWMIGHWSATHGDAEIELGVKWQNAYLIQQFVARKDGKVLRRSTQRIAWDPAAKRFRSWTFNTDGSFSEASWRRENDVWVVESSGVQADGGRIKATQFWTRVDNDVCWFKSVEGHINEQHVDDLLLKFSRRHSQHTEASATDSGQP